MLILENDYNLFFDVDETLIHWNQQEGKNLPKVKIYTPYKESERDFYIHKENIKLLKMGASRGKKIIVWSAAGFRWAEAVVKALEIEKYVYAVMTKPNEYCDDKNIEDWGLHNLYMYNKYGG